jgi:UDP-glucose 4-epimerase
MSTDSSQLHRDCPLSSIKGKKILITGGSGYIASSIASTLSGISCTIYRISRRKNQLVPLLGPADRIDIEGDITADFNWEQYLNQIDIIFHLGGQTSSYKSNADPVRDLQDNVMPVLNLLLACRRSGNRPLIVFAGTVTEIGLSKNLPVNEAHYEDPITIYDIHKLMAEKYLKYFVRDGRSRGCILRLANVYGPGPQSSSSDRGILNMMISRGLSGGTLKIYGSGYQIRDYIFIDDVVEAFLSAGVYGNRVNGHHFVIGSGEGCTIAEAVRLVAERILIKTGKTVKVNHIQPPENLSQIEERNFIAETSNFSASTGWRPRFALSEGIDRTIDFFNSRNQ